MCVCLCSDEGIMVIGSARYMIWRLCVHFSEHTSESCYRNIIEKIYVQKPTMATASAALTAPLALASSIRCVDAVEFRG